MSFRPLLLVTAIAATVALQSACEPQSCTLVGCSTPLSITIEGPNGAALPDSTYEIVLELDGSPYVTACGQPTPGEYFCEPVEGGGPLLVDVVYTTNGIIAIEVGNGDEDSGAPDRVVLSVMAGDAPLVDETWDVTYEEYEPNGPDCGPVCRQATEHLTAIIDLGGM